MSKLNLQLDETGLVRGLLISIFGLYMAAATLILADFTDKYTFGGLLGELAPPMGALFFMALAIVLGFGLNKAKDGKAGALSMLLILSCGVLAIFACNLFSWLTVVFAGLLLIGTMLAFLIGRADIISRRLIKDAPSWSKLPTTQPSRQRPPSGTVTLIEHDSTPEPVA